ncbi:hypothetical protein BGZ94_002553, partial [Podila epigama]
LNLVILRPAIVYGIGSMSGLTPRLICGRVYKQLEEQMDFLWGGDLKINTVHVNDVVRAVWHTANWYVSSDNSNPSDPVVFNLADDNDTTQEAVNTHIREIFGIKTGFKGDFTTKLSNVVLTLEEIIEEINDLHLEPWSLLLKANNIKNSPLTPYLDKELLSNNAISLDGTKICSSTGFTYDHPKMTTASLQEIIADFEALKIWPIAGYDKTISA